MANQGHGVIINLSSNLPFTFIYNPTEIKTSKKINYFEAPNIGGSHRKKYFTGFGNKQLTVNLVLIDKASPTGVIEDVSFFEQLREPDAGILGVLDLVKGNENYPPPKILFTYGTGSLVPLVWYVDDISISLSMFKTGVLEGVLGIPQRADVTLTLSLDAENILNKANTMAEKAAQIAGSVKSITREARRVLG